MRSAPKERLAFNNRATNGSTNPFPVIEYSHILFTLSSTWNANFTIKVQGSFSETQPNFAWAQTNDNRRDYVQVRDLQNGSNIDWDVWISFAWVDDVKQLEVNVDGLKWLWFTISDLIAGTVSTRIICFRD